MKKMIASITLAVIIFCSFSGYSQALDGQVVSDAKKFDGNSWLALSKKDRASAISSYIAEAKKKKIVIKKSPVSYAKRLDNYYINESRRSESVDKVLQTLMIMEYDFAVPGKNKDDLARSELGEDLYKKNKERLSKESR
jgi:hypothetical protein